MTTYGQVILIWGKPVYLEVPIKILIPAFIPPSNSTDHTHTYILTINASMWGSQKRHGYVGASEGLFATGGEESMD